MQSNSPKYHTCNSWFGWFGSSAKTQSFSKFHLLHFRIIMMKFARSSWENCRIWTVLKIPHVDGAFEEEGSVSHLQLLQGGVTWATMLIALKSVNNGKPNKVLYKKKKKETHIDIMVRKTKCFSSSNLCGLCCATFSDLQFTGYSGWYRSIKQQIRADYEASERIFLGKNTVMLAQNWYGQ